MSDAPIERYDEMTVAEVETAVAPYTNGIDSISDSEVVQRLDLMSELFAHELENKDRKTAKQSIDEVREAISAEAESRGLTDSVSEAGEERDDEDDEVEETDDAEEDESDDEEAVEEEEDEDEAEDVEEEEREPRPEESTFVGQQGKERIRVRNPERVSKNINGKQFHAGEVKDLVVNDVILDAIRRNELQVVRG